MTGKRDATFVSVVFPNPSLATPSILFGSVWFRPEYQSIDCATLTQKGHLLAHFIGQSQSDGLKLWFVYWLPLHICKTPVVYLSSSFRQKKGIQRDLIAATQFLCRSIFSFWTELQYSNIVWLPAFTSKGHYPEVFTTVKCEVCCWSSWNPLLKFFLESFQCSALWHSMIVIMPKIFFKSCEITWITKPCCSTFPQNSTWSWWVALSTFHKIFPDGRTASILSWLVDDKLFSMSFLVAFFMIAPMISSMDE